MTDAGPASPGAGMGHATSPLHSTAVRLALASFAVPTIIVAVFGASLGADSAADMQQLRTRQATIQALTERLATLRQETAAWSDVHARMALAVRAAGVDDDTSLVAPPAGPPPPARSALDAANGLAGAVAAETARLDALDRLVTRAERRLAAVPSRWPVRGVVTSGFGRRQSPWSDAEEFHSGLDIATDRGTPVRAPGAGVVAFAGPMAEFGTAIVVEHGPRLRTLYGHLSRLAVRRGDMVERGRVIGYSGNSGRSSGPHLHFEVLVDGRPVNPRRFLR